MKPLFLTYFITLIFSNSYGQDSVTRHNSDSISRLIDLSSKLPAHEEVDTIPCYDCPFMFVIISTKYFTDNATKQLVKVVEEKKYFLEIKSYPPQLIDSTATDYYYFTSRRLLKVVTTTSTRNNKPQTTAAYFSEGDINEWKRKGNPGPSINERESLVWTADYLLEKFKN